jgi:hypothetical protein
MRPTKRSGQPHPHGKGRGLDVSDVDCAVRWYLGVYIYIYSLSVDEISGIITSIDPSMHILDLFASKQGSDRPHVDMQPVKEAARWRADGEVR